MSSVRPGTGRGVAVGLAAAVLALASGCDAGGAGPLPTGPEGARRVAGLAVAGGEGQRIWSGQRSSAPFRVRVEDDAGEPLPGALVRFHLDGEARGILSQPQALADSAGVAETWLLESRSGAGLLVAAAGAARVEIAFTVARAPGRIEFAPGTGEAGLAGFPHPDSLVRARVWDTEGRPLQGTEVWFAGPGDLSSWADTTDADGWASTVLRTTRVTATDGTVWGFVLGFPVVGRTQRALSVPARRVVLVSIDGLRADALERWSPPTLLRMAEEGALAPRARTVTPSLTAPAHLSLLSGVEPEAHGIYSDELTFTPEMAALDPLFKSVGRWGHRTRAFIGREGPLAEFEQALQCKLAFGLDSLTLVSPEAREVAGAALPTVHEPAVHLVFVHLAEPDLAGHAHGFDSPLYGEAVRAADAALAPILSAAGDSTLVIVTSDHGGGGAYGPFQHGSSSPEDVEVPLLLWGAGVRPGSLRTAASILDVAPTIHWALGIAPPGQYSGRALLEAFGGG